MIRIHQLDKQIICHTVLYPALHTQLLEVWLFITVQNVRNSREVRCSATLDTDLGVVGWMRYQNSSNCTLKSLKGLSSAYDFYKLFQTDEIAQELVLQYNLSCMHYENHKGLRTKLYLVWIDTDAWRLLFCTVVIIVF